MDWQRAEAIVLRRQPVTETSLIVTWFTREFGKLKTMAKGARRPKGPFQGKIDLFYRDEILFLPSRRSDLHLLHDCFLENPHRRLRDSVARMTAASFACELVDLATEVEDVNERLFELLATILDTLETGSLPVILIWFELQVLAATGWSPRWEAQSGVEKVLRSLAQASVAGARRVRLSAAQLAEAQQSLWRFWDQQVGRAPRSRALLVTGPADERKT